MREYGISSPEVLVNNWTPAQIVLMFEQIHRRRAAEQAAQMERDYLAAAAAQGGKQGFRALKKATQDLRRAAGEKAPRLAEQFAAMGLSSRGKKPPKEADK